MRFEAKSESEAVEQAARELGIDAKRVEYRVVRDEKSFWGGRIVEIEVPEPERREPMPAEPVAPVAPERVTPHAEVSPAPREATRSAERFDRVGEGAGAPPAGAGGSRRAPEAVLDDEAFAVVESTLSELLSVAGFLLETRRRASADEMVFELMGDDVEPLLTNKGEGLNGLEVLTGRIASRRLGRPVYPRLDAEGFRAHQRESLEELAQRSAEEAKRTRRPQLLPPLSPSERRLVHLALAADPEVETESEGDGFLKRVAVKLKAR
ncbi:MAG: Jag N-terminal domain-containing protein [Acidobacteriota bacterium]|nr:Jag N-terminal domain-containing protein [Acidobacteriota bacterium]